jgi:hypothetical protein
MKATRVLLLAVAVVLPLAAGCTQRLKPYESIKDPAVAEQSADVVATGEILKVDTVKHFLGDEVTSPGIGKLGTDCVAQERVQMRVQKVLKGSPSGDSLVFDYYGPCFHPAKGIKIVTPELAFVKGDKTTVYLKNENGGLWMIAHKLVPPPQPAQSETFRERIFTGD